MTPPLALSRLLIQVGLVRVPTALLLQAHVEAVAELFLQTLVDPRAAVQFLT